MLAFPNFFNKGYSTLLTTGRVCNTALAAVPVSTVVVMFFFVVLSCFSERVTQAYFGQPESLPDGDVPAVDTADAIQIPLSKSDRDVTRNSNCAHCRVVERG